MAYMIHGLLRQLETEARERAENLERDGILPPGFVEQHYRMGRADQLELRRLKAALAAATDVDTFVALAKGEPVPARRLQPDIVRYHNARR